MNKNKSYENFINIFLCMIAGAMLISFCMDTSGNNLIRPQFLIVVLAAAMILFVLRKKLPKAPVYYVISGGVFIKFCYIYYTEVWNRQHDVIDFGVGEGQAAYIEYFLEHKRFPDFDPRSIWGFFQPPLHHMSAAAWMWLQRRLGVTQKLMQENVQVLTLCYMIVVMVVAYAICKELNMKERGMLITMLLISFHPLFILFSGSINNDALAFCLSMVAVYIALLWYHKPSYIMAALLAVFIGLSMFAKLTSGLVAPAIGALMLYSLVMNRDKWKSYIGQFVLFGAIVFPLGLFWPIRNKLLFDMPANYIPPVGEQLTHSDIFSRVFDIRIHSVYPAMISLGDEYDEYNTLVMIIKSSLFGEYNYGQYSRLINPFSVVLFVTGTALAIVCLYGTAHMIFSKKSMMLMPYKIFLGLLYAAFLAGYLSFSLGYNNFSAQDFRYAAMAIIAQALFLGIWTDECEERTAKAVLYLTVIFAAASFAVYLMIGIFQ